MHSNLLNENKYLNQALQVLNLIESKGFETWIVGGCIRDALLCREGSDIDIATSASWKDVEDICIARDFGVKRSGVKHGTVTVLVPNDSGDFATFEVTTFRIDSQHSSDSRHPDYVEFTDSIVEDLARRDFTMNAIAWHPKRGLLDPFGGVQDIESGIIRVVGDPKSRFKEDALRILRGCRFASQLRFNMDPGTYIASVRSKSLLLKISSERVTSELTLLLMGDFVHDAIMDYADVLSICVPELVAMRDCPQKTKFHIYNVLEHTAWAVQYSKKTPVLRWAAFCHDMGKPSCGFFDERGVQHFYGHAIAGERVTRGLMENLSFSKKHKDRVCEIVRYHNDVIKPENLSIKKALVRVGGNVELLIDVLDLKIADMLAHAPEYTDASKQIEQVREQLIDIVDSGEVYCIAQLELDGSDLIDLGIVEGPDIGRVLNGLLYEVIDGSIDNERDSLISAARRIALQ